jgi:G3E family GTPase
VLVADELVVTKLDLVEHEEDAAATIAAALRTMNPAAGLRTALHGVLGEAPPEAPKAPPLTRTAGETALAHTDDVASLSLQPDGPIDWLGFAVWLSMLLHARGQDVLRVKGLVELDDQTLVSVNGVQHVVHTPEHLDRSTIPDPTAGIVFITRGIEIERLRESFDAFQRLARTTSRLETP